MINRDRLVNEFMDIVRIDSLTKKERTMADFLKGKLGELGLEVSEDQAGEACGGEAGNVIGVLDGDEGKTALMFLAHMDRVKPGEGVQPVLEGDVIKSDGKTVLGSDDGAGIAAILEMLRVIKENNVAHGRLEVVFTIAEEGGLFGAKGLDVEKLKARKGIVLDSTGEVGTVINRAPAQDEIVARVFGKASHAGVSPEKGINAIVVAAKAISRMKIGRIDEETTSNIGIIEGGKATNIVPDFVEVRGEARSRVEEKLVAATEGICREFIRAAEEENTRVELDVKRLYPAYYVQEDDELLKLVHRAGESAGLKIEVKPTGGGSDANIINGKGVTAVNLAVGNEEVHTVEEYIRASDMVKITELALKIVELA
ncbi:MAG: M20/M25/M40 family metallo-hydrolase [Dethiobacter sp.]|jgi:tripeptide aminopeptidase|nr:M20/M25/M40 family metallo-hydrolase [Dethiobacter sp.]